MFEQDITAGPGTGNFTSHTLEILIMLLGAFLLGLWLGWVLWNKYKQAFDRLRTDNDALQASIGTLNGELGTLKAKVVALDKERGDLTARVAITDSENTDLRAKIAALQSDVSELETENRQLETEVALNQGEAETIQEIADAAPTEAPDLATVTGDEALLDAEPADGHTTIDLSVEETTTPSTPVLVTDPAPIAEPEPVVVEATATDYSAASDEPIVIHDDHNFRFVMQDHDEADALQQVSARSLTAAPATADPTSLDHFSDDSYTALSSRAAAPAPVEAMEAAAPIGFVTLKQDDLKIIEGIGPKIEELLFKAGISTYSELAAAPVARLKEILVEAGPRFQMHDPGTWSAQALLAANGEWENLKAYQGFLDSGKAPSKK
jgi:predicted flap endonuclease-1-like 5' DNA nuclease/cell division protein FtsB